jgi:hypothetical protein
MRGVRVTGLGPHAAAEACHPLPNACVKACKASWQLRMELAQDRKARRLAIDRRRQRLREIDRRLKTEYQANKATPFSLSLCELLEKIEIMPTGRGDGVPS